MLKLMDSESQNQQPPTSLNTTDNQPQVVSGGPGVIQPSGPPVEKIESAQTVISPDNPRQAVSPSPATANVIQPSSPNLQNSNTDPQTVSGNSAPSPQIENSSTPLFSANSEYVKKSESKYKIPWKILIPVLGGVLVIGLLLYFLILPIYWSDSYMNSSKTAYDTQSTDMTAVYVSFGRPVFSSNTSLNKNDSTDLSYTQGVITKASAATTSLKAKNHLIALPMTTWLHPVASANKRYNAMQQYVGDSQTFLSDYQTLVTYVTQLEKLEQSQEPQLSTALQAVGNSKSVSQFLTTSQAASTALTAYIKSLKSLHPSIDVQGVNTNLINSLSALNTALLGIINGVNTSDPEQLIESSAQLQSSLVSLSQTLNTNIASFLQTNSVIKQQINKLESEKPLN